MSKLIAVIFIATFLAAMMLFEPAEAVRTSKLCGHRLLNYVMEICPNGCVQEITPLLEKACGLSMSDEELKQTCCPADI